MNLMKYILLRYIHVFVLVGLRLGVFPGCSGCLGFFSGSDVLAPLPLHVRCCVRRFSRSLRGVLAVILTGVRPRLLQKRSAWVLPAM